MHRQSRINRDTERNCSVAPTLEAKEKMRNFSREEASFENIWSLTAGADDTKITGFNVRFREARIYSSKTSALGRARVKTLRPSSRVDSLA